MGKKKHGSALGNAIIRDRFGKRKHVGQGGEQFLHTTDLNDGYDWGRLNLQSVTEQSNLDDFLTTAEMAGTEFTAERLNIKVVDLNKHAVLQTEEEKQNIQALHTKHKNLLSIPRRPKWDENTTPEELDRREKDVFLSWRRVLASLQEVEGLELTPYEKNLDFWRQLWRVIERSDVVVQIVDARNPLLFRCEDLQAYVKEIDDSKVNLILANKADYLTQTQRNMWYQYFSSQGIRVVFWSAKEETERQTMKKEMESDEDDLESDDDDVSGEDDEEDDEEEKEKESEEEDKDSGDEKEGDSKTELVADRLQNTDINRDSVKTEGTNLESGDRLKECTDESIVDTHKDCDIGACSQATETCSLDTGTSQATETCSLNTGTSQETGTCSDKKNNDTVILNKDNPNCETLNKSSTGSDPLSCDKCDNETLLPGAVSQSDMEEEAHCIEGAKCLTGEELLDFFRTLHSGKKFTEGQTTIGMVGYPNVGKSSTINAILKMKKVPVSATPGRTKHFQTLYVDRDLMLCDCPGLVFPSFVSTKAELVTNGILPIDQLRDCMPPIALVCENIQKEVLEETYSINLPRPQEGEDPDRKPYPMELLNTYAYMRGYMTNNGIPDCPRAARYILKDFVNGKLLYCEAPPGVDKGEFKPSRIVTITANKETDSQPEKLVPSQLDREFFAREKPKMHSLGSGRQSAGFVRVQGLQQIKSDSASSSPYSSMSSLAEKPWKKHGNRKRKEKLRRVYGHHDLTDKY